MIYSTGVCKPFPPPLVRGGVFLVGSDAKYRVIADGNSAGFVNEIILRIGQMPSTAL